MDRSNSFSCYRKLEIAKFLVLTIVLCQVALCTAQISLGPDHMIFDPKNLPDKPPNKKPAPAPYFSSSSSSEEEVDEVDSIENVISGKDTHGYHKEIFKNTEESGGAYFVESYENNDSSETGPDTGTGTGMEIGTRTETGTGTGTRIGTKTFDTKTFLNGVSILTGFPDPDHCDILDAWACNAEQTKVVCPNRCAKLAQAVDAPWCQKDKQYVLCNHHDARWMCPSFCAAIDAKDCDLFEDWACKAEKAKKICPDRCNNVNFTTDAPWCAQHGDDAGCRWLCKNPDANQMCAFFCLLHGYPLIGPNDMPMGIPPGFMSGIQELIGMTGAHHTGENPGMGNLPGMPGRIPGMAGTGELARMGSIPIIPGGISGIARPEMGSIQGIPGGIPAITERGKFPGVNGGLIGSISGSQTGNTGSQTGLLGSQTVFPGSQTELLGFQARFPGTHTGFPGSQTEFPSSQTGFSGSQTGLPGSQIGTPGSQTGFLGSKSTFPGTKTKFLGSQTGFPGSQTGFLGSQFRIPGSQTRFPGSQTGYPGTQTGFPGSPPGFPGPQTGFTGSQSGYSWGSSCSQGSIPDYPGISPCALQAGIQVAYPGGGKYGNGIDTGYGIKSGGAYG